MPVTRRGLGSLLLGAGAWALAGASRLLLFAQDRTPSRRTFTVTARNYTFDPSRIEVSQDDLVRISLRGEDQAHSLTIDEYRISRRVDAGGATTIEFRADRPGTFAFYCGISTDPECRRMRGQFVVQAK